ncbi:cell division protein ZapA [Prosthecochloris sp. HL-130-GSB]|jgi:cell division protein ZapA|uniref:Cell division protein ZapA n=1 Tax=Prosthecochloris aestuarii TaxID=1102 RepID=A0A831SS69_PROAE|nr:cell division protein ZapA [Prosthecochloris sp. HL-130-GSB]ARM31116.1 cell division protein ZapA [Prosthecochloris sp. HL-130-GSB]MBO8092058.1 cell division protein ZapA [Prosthecochloris sp.]HED31143.1 cell division protein ZapA [Prosthecochloris aestuarii]
MEKINVNIFGDSYPLRVESRESTEAAAREVDEMMQQFSSKAPDLEVKKFAVLAAVHFAEKKNELEAELSVMEAKIARLNDFLGQHLR